MAYTLKLNGQTVKEVWVVGKHHLQQVESPETPDNQDTEEQDNETETEQ